MYALRIIGLYMVLPVLSPYAASLRGSTGMLTGLAIGAYGLSQGLFQIPFGSLSDRIGRKRAIVFGLSLFAIGSAIAGAATSALVLILGRFVQGMGAIASVVVALAADLTREQVRTQAMARIGVWVGGAFALGMTAGPFVAGAVGVPALFWTTAALSALGAVQLMVAVPEPRRRRMRQRQTSLEPGASTLPSGEPGEPGEPAGTGPDDRLHTGDLRFLLSQRPLLLLDVGTFLLHLTLTAIFVVLPFVFEEQFGPGEIGRAVVPIVVVGLAAMVLAARHTDRTGQSARVFLVGGALFLAACIVLAVSGTRAIGAVAGLGIFVLAVACLEPTLPALTTRFAVGPHRGAAMGVFHMSQFLGSFIGGLVGGAALGGSLLTPFLLLAVAVAAWLVAAGSLAPWTARFEGK
ncbi:MAG: MFS transporter [Candidatus Eisenbacteria bacterium]